MSAFGRVLGASPRQRGLRVERLTVTICGKQAGLVPLGRGNAMSLEGLLGLIATVVITVAVIYWESRRGEGSKTQSVSYELFAYAILAVLAAQKNNADEGDTSEEQQQDSSLPYERLWEEVIKRRDKKTEGGDLYGKRRNKRLKSRFDDALNQLQDPKSKKLEPLIEQSDGSYQITSAGQAEFQNLPEERDKHPDALFAVLEGTEPPRGSSSEAVHGDGTGDKQPGREPYSRLLRPVAPEDWKHEDWWNEVFLMVSDFEGDSNVDQLGRDRMEQEIAAKLAHIYYDKTWEALHESKREFLKKKVHASMTYNLREKKLAENQRRCIVALEAAPGDGMGDKQPGREPYSRLLRPVAPEDWKHEDWWNEVFLMVSDFEGDSNVDQLGRDRMEQEIAAKLAHIYYDKTWEALHESKREFLKKKVHASMTYNLREKKLAENQRRCIVALEAAPGDGMGDKQSDRERTITYTPIR